MQHLFRRHRHPAAYPIQIQTSTGTTAARVVDVHQNGVRLQGVDRLGPGDHIALTHSPRNLSGTVRWARDNEAGVQFDTTVSPSVVDTFRFEQRATAATTRYSTSRMQELP